LFVVIIGVFTINNGIKLIVDRERPPLALVVSLPVRDACGRHAAVARRVGVRRPDPADRRAGGACGQGSPRETRPADAASSTATVSSPWRPRLRAGAPRSAHVTAAALVASRTIADNASAAAPGEAGFGLIPSGVTCGIGVSNR
jgi:hypothetical protein